MSPIVKNQFCLVNFFSKFFSELLNLQIIGLDDEIENHLNRTESTRENSPQLAQTDVHESLAKPLDNGSTLEDLEHYSWFVSRTASQ